MKCIDAPELAQNYGNTCQEILKGYANEENLRVQFVGEDSYNRKLIYLVRPDYSEINFDLITVGCAWVYSPSRSRRENYKAAFKVAWTSQVGVFSLDKHCQPSKFRRGTCAE